MRTRLWRQAQAGVFAFVIIDVYFDLADLMQGLAVGSLHAFQICRKDVIRFAGRNALGKFSAMVGVDLPLGFFVLSAADFDRDAVDRPFVGTPDRPKNQGVLILRGLGIGCQLAHSAWGRKQDSGEQEAEQRQTIWGGGIGAIRYRRVAETAGRAGAVGVPRFTQDHRVWELSQNYRWEGLFRNGPRSSHRLPSPPLLPLLHSPLPR